MQDELIIYRSRIPKSLYFLFLLVCIVLTVGSMVDGKILHATIMLAIGGVLHFVFKRQPKRAQALIKISEERLWTRNRGNKYWKSVRCIKFRYHPSGTVYMDIYVSNDFVADEELDLREANISIWRLRRRLKKYAKIQNH
jgi:Ca2+/Na+ antiporter